MLGINIILKQKVNEAVGNLKLSVCALREKKRKNERITISRIFGK